MLTGYRFGELSEWSKVQHSKSCDILPNYPNNFIWKRIEVVVTSRTRNAVVRKGTWVRIPPLPPEKPQKRLFLGLFSILLHGALPVCCPAALLPGAGIYAPDHSWFPDLKTPFVA